MHSRTHSTLLLAAGVLLLAVPSTALGQADSPANPNDRPASTAPANVALPTGRVTRDDIRRALVTFTEIEVDLSATVDNGGGADSHARLGNLEIPNGTRFTAHAAFSRGENSPEPILRSLEFTPGQPLDMGPATLRKFRIDDHGDLLLDVTVPVLGKERFRLKQRKREADGSLVFDVKGSFLGGIVAGFVAPRIRVRPDGTVQVWSATRLPLIGLMVGRKRWKNLEVDGAPVRIPLSGSLEHWPLSASDVLAFIPEDDETPSADEARSPIPISDLSIHLEATSAGHTVRLPNGHGTLRLSDDRLTIDARGRFEGRRWRSTSEEDNRLELTATLEGEIAGPRNASAHIEPTTIRLTGRHSSDLDLDRPDDAHLEARFDVLANADLARVHIEHESGASLTARDGARMALDARGSVTVSPATGEFNVEIDRDSRAELTVDGPIEVRNFDRLTGSSIDLPDTLTLVAADDPTTPDVDESEGPVIRSEARLGTRTVMGGTDRLIYARTSLDMDAATTSPGIVGVLLGEEGGTSSVRTTLRAGSRLHVDAEGIAGMGTDLSDAASRTDLDVRIEGIGENTEVNLPTAGLRASLPNASRIAAHTSLNLRSGNEAAGRTGLRTADTGLTVELLEDGGSFEVELPNGDRGRATLGAGSSLELETDRLDLGSASSTRPADARARLRGHLVLLAGSVEHGRLAAHMEGRATLDIDGDLALNLNPEALRRGGSGNPITGPVSGDLNVAMDFGAGSTLRVGTDANETTVELGAPSRITLHAAMEADPASGRVHMKALDGVDVLITLKAAQARELLTAMGNPAEARLESETTIRIRNARIEIGDMGVTVHHGGVTIELAAGSFTLGRPPARRGS